MGQLIRNSSVFRGLNSSVLSGLDDSLWDAVRGLVKLSILDSGSFRWLRRLEPLAVATSNKLHVYSMVRRNRAWTSVSLLRRLAQHLAAADYKKTKEG